MNNKLVPIICGTALAIMCGAVGSHYASVGQIIELTESQLNSNQRDITVEKQQLVEVQEVIKRSADQKVALTQALKSNEEALEAAGETVEEPGRVNPDLKEILAELVSQNKYLRDQIAETNRDMMELQFRVDSQSDQFRPLQVTEEITYDPTIGVLPPRE